MEAQLDDIRDNLTVTSLHTLKDTIFDCAKNIKSNDVTFQISTLPIVSQRLVGLLNDYGDIVKDLETNQQAFTQVYDLIEQNQDEQPDSDFIDLDNYLHIFKLSFEAAKKDYKKDDSVRNELAKLLRLPCDEEIQVEDPTHEIPKDPITKKPIEVAVRSKVCKHVFDRNTIHDYIRQCETANADSRIKKVKCPLAGCTNRNLTRKELELDEEINQMIQSL